MEGLDNSNAATVNTNTSSSATASNSTLLTFNLPLDSFASAPTPAQRSMNPGVLAICLTNESSGAANCYVYSTCKFSHTSFKALVVFDLTLFAFCLRTTMLQDT